jgi:hypothetical protein
MEEIGLSDEVKIVKNPLISDEQQIEELEFAEAQEAWCAAACRAVDCPSVQTAMQKTEAEVTLVNRFMAGSKNPLMRRAWSAYFYRLTHHHRREA